MINLHIPVTPFGKGSIRVNKRGVAYKDEKTDEYMRLVKTFIINGYPGPMLEGPLAVELTFSFPLEGFGRIKYKGEPYMRHKPDLDNLEKAIHDCATGVLWSDDALIVKKTSEKIWSEAPQGTYIHAYLV